MNVCLLRMAHFHSQEEVKYSYEQLAANASINGDCLVYGSTGKYHDIKVRHFGPGRVIRIYAHRLALLKKMNSLDIPKTVEASHFCHEKACIKLEHIVAEPRHVNMSRITCMNERVCQQEPHFCFGHPGFANCV